MHPMPRRRFTEAEYLIIERASDFKSEYLDGQMYAMAGVGEAHGLIAMNVAASLHTQFRGRPCKTFASDMRVRVADSGLYAYPDVTALCGESRVLDTAGDTLLNPQLIVEVLSPSTASYDHGEKGRRYRQLESLTDYLLIAQDRMFVTHWSRQSGQPWNGREYDQPTDRIPVASLAVKLQIDELYERVVFPSATTASTIRLVR